MKPQLYIFGISHFCEKARWALDYLEIDFDIVHVGPGLHLRVARKLGVPASTYPILVADGRALQGSGAIIDWADAATATTKTLTPVAGADECRRLEERFDEVSGVHTRRMFYSEAIVEHPAMVRPIFLKDLPLSQRLLVGAAWPIIRKGMVRGLDLGREQGQESQRILDGELTWLEGVLSDGRAHLVGDTVTRADVTAASLFGRLAHAPEHPSYEFLFLPPRLAAELASWKERPALVWIREIYRKHRWVAPPV